MRPPLAALAFLALGQPGLAAEPRRSPVSEEQRRACRDDAFRLCPAQVALMRREAVRTCLKAKAEQLSPLCRSAFAELRERPLPPQGGQP